MYFNVKDYGAAGDGRRLETKAIQAAVNDCARAGGGRVYFPNGFYRSGAIELLDGVTLYLDTGAVIKASDNLDDYKQLDEDLPYTAKENGSCRAFIYAIGRKNVGLDGHGTIDLSDEAFNDFDVMSYSPAIDVQTMTAEQRAEGVARYYFGRRPTQPISFINCENVHARNLNIRHSPFWTLVFTRCRHVFVNGLNIQNRMNTANCDGIGTSGCENVTISDCQISTADDCITVCCPAGNREANICISNCTLRSRSSAVRIGYRAGNIEDVVISNLVIHQANRGIIIQAIDGGLIQNIAIQNIVMHTALLAGSWWGKAEPLSIGAVNGKGTIRRIMMSNVLARCENGIAIYGNENGNISDITLRDWRLNISEGKNRAVAPYIDLEDEAKPELPAGRTPWIFAKNVKRLYLDNVIAERDEKDPPKDITPILENAEIIQR